MENSVAMIIAITFITLIMAMLVIPVATHKRCINKFSREATSRGTVFEAEIIGAAPPKTILYIKGQESKLIKFLSFNKIYVDPSPILNSDEALIISRVKIEYIDPTTQQRTIAHKSLAHHEIADYRILRITKPSRIKEPRIYAEHNRQLFEEYSSKVKSRKLDTAQENRILREAVRVIMAIDGKIDDEGYQILNPPVKAEGYMLDGEILFTQKTSIPNLTDWTIALE